MNVCLKVNGLLLEFNCNIIICKVMTTQEWSSRCGLHFEAILSTEGYQAGNNEKHFIVMWLQTYSSGKVAAVFIACFKCEPEELCAGEEA